MDNEKCPVCWRWVKINKTWRMRQHDDTIGQPCKMSGQEYPPRPLALIA